MVSSDMMVIIVSNLYTKPLKIARSAKAAAQRGGEGYEALECIGKDTRNGGWGQKLRNVSEIREVKK